MYPVSGHISKKNNQCHSLFPMVMDAGLGYGALPMPMGLASQEHRHKLSYEGRANGVMRHTWVMSYISRVKHPMGVQGDHPCQTGVVDHSTHGKFNISMSNNYFTLKVQFSKLK
jgi:hypothetical protein